MNFIFGILRLLLNQAGQIPSSVTDQYDALLTTTLRKVQPKLRDNITRGNRFLAWLESKGRFKKQTGGYNVRVPLMHAQNSTADIMSGYGLVDTTPQDGITSAFFDWSQLAVSITISQKEERQNAGEGKIIDLLKSKTMQSEVTIKELLNNCILAGRITSSTNLGQFLPRAGRLDSGASGPLPLAALIDASPARSVSVGNINGSTYSFWRNQAKSSTATSFTGLKLEMNNIYNTCTKGVGGNPDLCITDQVGWETYWGSLIGQERYMVDDKKTIDILGGTDALKFRGSVIIWDEVVPDVETTAEIVDGVGTVSASNIHFVNSESMEYIVESGSDFETTPFVRPENQLARTALIHWMGMLGVNQRRKNGVLYGISQSITS
jgi:hypothetical protein